MAHSLIEASTLVPFEDVAAGHDGTLTDPSGLLFVKPCKPHEIAFYEQSIAHHAEFAEFMPTYLGVLSLASPEQEQMLQKTASSTGTGRDASDAPDLTLAGIPPSLLGAKINTDQAVVLENLVAGFVKPNVMDIKLGAVLWDEGAPVSKRQRMDKLAAETTSSTLGFRVAGMRVWQDVQGTHHDGKGHGPKIYGKAYGRSFTADTVNEAFREFFFGSAEEKPTAGSARHVVVQLCEAVIGQIQEILTRHESRMISSSLLLIFEGDAETLEMCVAAAERQQDGLASTSDAENEEDDGVDEDDDEDPLPEGAICRVRIIDFAHASWTPGQGPDENMLQGVRNVQKILRTMYDNA